MHLSYFDVIEFDLRLKNWPPAPDLAMCEANDVQAVTMATVSVKIKIKRDD